MLTFDDALRIAAEHFGEPFAPDGWEDGGAFLVTPQRVVDERRRAGRLLEEHDGVGRVDERAGQPHDDTRFMRTGLERPRARLGTSLRRHGQRHDASFRRKIQGRRGFQQRPDAEVVGAW